MTKNIVALFAHPDDEAFGPGGTLAKLAKENNVYLLCATKGDAGNHHGKKVGQKTHNIRAQEIKNSAKILGVKQVYFLGFKDGKMCNFRYHQIAEKAKKYLEKIKPEIVVTFEPRGVSGHIDHITITYVTLYLSERLPFIKEVWMYCAHHKLSSALHKNYFVYMPPGYKESEVDKVVDIRDVWEQKVQAIHQHQSQKEDIETILGHLKKLPKLEYFLVYKY